LKDPPLEVLKDFQREWHSLGKPPLAFDIETNWSGGEDETEFDEISLEETKSYEISRLSLAFREGHAITVPWQEPWKGLCQAILGEAQDLTVWNEEFDCPRLMADGVTFTGQIYDAMKAYHLMIPSLPYNLQAASSMIVGRGYRSWKNESSVDMPWYSCRDSDFLLRCFNHTKAKLVQDGKWPTFVRHFVEVGRILRKMSKRGVPIDRERRLEARERFASELESVRAQAQPLVPRPLLPLKIFKSTEKQLTKKFGALEAPLWTTVEVPLTESEIKRLNEKSLKALEREKRRLDRLAQKQLAKLTRAQLLSDRASAKPKRAKRGGVKCSPVATTPPTEPTSTTAVTLPLFTGEATIGKRGCIEGEKL
jgi:DNA polymerase I-like protein with 3'-5' exonuclease and polymerase domains